jgi:hypothetical protein
MWSESITPSERGRVPWGNGRKRDAYAVDHGRLLNATLANGIAGHKGVGRGCTRCIVLYVGCEARGPRWGVDEWTYRGSSSWCPRGEET